MDVDRPTRYDVGHSYNMDQNWAQREVQLAFDGVDRLFFSSFKSLLRMIGQYPTHWSKASLTFGGCD